MDLHFIFKSKEFGIRRPEFNLVLHTYSGHSETLFSPGQMVSALLIHNTAVKLKTKKNKKEKETATTYGKTEYSACRKIDTQYKSFAFLPPFLPFIHLFSSTLN